jgi:hypothetical protein
MNIRVCICAGALIVSSLAAQTPAPEARPTPRERQFKETVYFPPAAHPEWPLAPGDQAYAAINGEHLMGYVKELIGIAERYRDQGHQYWGRITGTSADAETAKWVMDKLRAVGVTDVHSQDLDLPPQWMPVSWEVTASGNGKIINLDTAAPMVRTPGTSNGETLDLEAAYVGLGTEADFIGRNVNGKAVFIEAVGLPGAWQQSASVYDAPRRAFQYGAKAIFLVVGLPGNFRTEIAGSTQIPSFTLGFQQGAAVRGLIEQSAGKDAPRIRVRSDIQMQAGQKTSLVWGVIPGMSDEKIIINAHRDGYFDAANDNATGVATAIGLAEYYAKMPKEQRRRGIVIVSNPGHHNTAVGSQWMVAHKDTFFAKTALIINSEHTAQVGVDLYGYKLVGTNMPSNFDWFANGSAKFKSLVTADWDRFGVSRYAEATERANGDMGSFSSFGPSIQLIAATPFYHSDHDSLQTIPPSGLAAVTRSYAKIIDDVNKLELKDLQ